MSSGRGRLWGMGRGNDVRLALNIQMTPHSWPVAIENACINHGWAADDCEFLV
jgi:hypothetical protein